MLLGLAEKNRLYVGDAWLGRKRGKEIGKADDCIGRKKLPLVEGGERIVNGQYKVQIRILVITIDLAYRTVAHSISSETFPSPHRETCRCIGY